MDDNENSNFRFLKDAFQKFAQKYKSEDISSRFIRSIAAGGKAATDRGLKEFPKTFLGQVAKDVYDLITSQELSDGISATVQSFDEEKVQKLLDDAIAPFKNPETALEIVKAFKQAATDPDAAFESLEKLLEDRSDIEKAVIQSLLDNVKKSMRDTKDLSLDDWLIQLEGLASMVPGLETIAPIVFMQIRPIVEGMKDAPDEEIAERVVEMAEMIPTDMLAQMAAAYTREVTPERVSKQAHDLVGKLPSPGAVADIVHGVGESASRHFEDASKIETPAEVQPIVQDFIQEAAGIVQDVVQKDNAAKKTFDKKGGSFDL